MTLIVIQQIFLSPSTTEIPVDPVINENLLRPEEALRSVRSEPRTQVPGIPENKIPDYSINNMKFTSAKGDTKDWKLDGQIAHVFRSDNLIYTREIQLELYGGGAEPTLVVGQESKYTIGKRDIEIYGNVVTKFPDGFEMYSQYLHYQPDLKLINVPENEHIRGRTESDDEKTIDFESQGMQFAFNQNEVKLLKDVRVTMIRKSKPSDKKTAPDKTTIYSDYALIDRNKQISHFMMNASRPAPSRFVRIEQPDTNVRSRTADLLYGNYSDILQYLTAFEDVFIREFDEGKEVRSATCGRADFDTKENIIVLTLYPQVYQGEDTVTGDKIRIIRDSDVVEIDHSNAYSEGK